MTPETALLRLMTWLSPSFPVGGYSYSHGIEYAVESGAVFDGATLTGWIEGIVRFGAGRLDADLFRDAWRAAEAGDTDELARVAEIGSAYRPTRELALESAAQGRAFLDTVAKVWPHPLLERLEGAAFPVAVGVATAGASIPLRSALSAYLHGFSSNLVSAGVRLIPLGQTGGQRTIAALEPVIGQAVDECLARPPGDRGGAAFMVDWTSMKHETQYTRLFRS